MKRPQRTRYAIAVASIAAAVSGLVGGSPAGAATTATKPAKAPTKASAVFPAMTVKALPSGKDFAFASLAAETKPVLVWFWAPT